jgi:hypothetical protein
MQLPARHRQLSIAAAAAAAAVVQPPAFLSWMLPLQQLTPDLLHHVMLLAIARLRQSNLLQQLLQCLLRLLLAAAGAAFAT